ncbi:sensor histidine kinase [Streptomyces cinereoruber]|uniref:sensor histidine kinase n=1 Tax=Streptomyces cinereoruber TaxID=67260 RepID=UPI0036315411
MHATLFGRFPSWTRGLLLCLGATLVSVVMATALFADHRSGVYGSPLANQARLSAVSVFLLPPAWLLRRSRVGPWALATAGCAAGVVSLGCSVWMHVAAGQPGSSAARADAYTLFEISALVVLLIVTVLRGPAWPAAVAAVVLCAAVALRPVAVETSENSLLVALFSTFAVCAALAGALVARLVTAERRRHTERVRLEQRLAFARDLHDFVAHHVTGIVVQAQGAQAVAASRPQASASALEQIERTAAEALKALRHMVSGLRTEAATELVRPGDVEQMRSLVADFALPAGGRAHFVQEGRTGGLSASAAQILHRVVMESLTNIRKHAPTSRKVSVALRVHGGTAELDVVNDRPTPRRDIAGYGLIGLEERVKAEGGTFRAGLDDQGLWRVSARIPSTGTWRAHP